MTCHQPTRHSSLVLKANKTSCKWVASRRDSLLLLISVLQMILTNAMCALSQALDLRWLEVKTRSKITQMIDKHGIKMPEFKMAGASGASGGDLWGFIPWYDAAYCPRRVAGVILDNKLSPTNHINREEFISEMAADMEQLMADLSGGKYVQEVAETSGTGTQTLHNVARILS
jgi:hypothetical protein